MKIYYYFICNKSNKLSNIYSFIFISQRSSDRSWKQIWGVLRGPILFFYKDRHSQVIRKLDLILTNNTVIL